MRHITCVLFVLAILLPVSAYSVISTAELHTANLTDGFSGKISGKLDSKRGNTEKDKYAFGFGFRLHQPGVTQFFLGSYDYAEVIKNDVRSRNTFKRFLHARDIRQLGNSWVDWETFVQYNDNQFTRLSLRLLGGVGFRFRAIDDDNKNKLYFGLGAFREKERQKEATGATDDGIEYTTRGNIYMIIRHDFAYGIRITSGIYFQPDVGDAQEDSRFFANTTLSKKISENLSLKLAHTIAEDHEPPQLVKPSNNSYSIALTYTFDFSSNRKGKEYDIVQKYVIK